MENYLCVPPPNHNVGDLNVEEIGIIPATWPLALEHRHPLLPACLLEAINPSLQFVREWPRGHKVGSMHEQGRLQLSSWDK